MKLLIETTLKSFLVALIEANRVLKYIFHSELQRKSDLLPQAVEEIIGPNTSKIEGIYVTKGPGSFMGIRAGLLYSYTIAKTLGIDLYTTSTLNFISNNQPGTYYLDARSNQSFYKTYPDGEEGMTSYHPDSPFDLEKFLINPQQYLQMFKKTQKIEPNYLKKPKVA